MTMSCRCSDGRSTTGGVPSLGLLLVAEEQLLLMNHTDAHHPRYLEIKNLHYSKKNERKKARKKKRKKERKKILKVKERESTEECKKVKERSKVINTERRKQSKEANKKDKKKAKEQEEKDNKYSKKKLAQTLDEGHQDHALQNKCYV